MDKIDEILGNIYHGWCQNCNGEKPLVPHRDEEIIAQAKSAILNLLLTEEEILGIINNICGWNFKAEILVKALNSAQLRKVGV